MNHTPWENLSEAQKVREYYNELEALSKALKLGFAGKVARITVTTWLEDFVDAYEERFGIPGQDNPKPEHGKYLRWQNTLHCVIQNRWLPSPEKARQKLEEQYGRLETAVEQILMGGTNILTEFGKCQDVFDQIVEIVTGRKTPETYEKPKTSPGQRRELMEQWITTQGKVYQQQYGIKLILAQDAENALVFEQQDVPTRLKYLENRDSEMITLALKVTKEREFEITKEFLNEPFEYLKQYAKKSKPQDAA